MSTEAQPGDHDHRMPVGAEAGVTEKNEEATAPRQWIYRNLTPFRIHACFGEGGTLLPRERATDAPDATGATGAETDHVFSVPALGEVTLPAEDASRLDTVNMRRLGQIEVRPAPSEYWTNLPRAIVIFGWLVVGLTFGAWALFFGGASGVPWSWAVAAVVAVPVAALVVGTVREVRLYRRFNLYRADRDDGRVSFEGVSRGNRICGFVDAMPRHAAEVVVLGCAVAVSVVGLGLAIELTTQLKDLLPIDYARLFQLHNPFEGLTDAARDSRAFWQLLVGHIAQWVFVSVAALAPGAMYFQFDRQRLASVQRRWIREVFRLDPTVRTVRDIEAKYDAQIESSFGDLGPDSGARLRSGRRSPVVVATVLLVVGWFLIIATTRVPELVPAAGASERWVWSSSPSNVFPVSAFFRPQLTLVGYAFLGSYVFTLYHVMRGYQRRDLHPKTYNTVVIRILSAYALALVVGVVYKGRGAEVLLFFVGFTPQTALVWLREKLSEDRGPAKAVPLHEPAPLTDLEGIDLYDRARLAEEGINNVEGLAHADIVDLMSSTRISAPQLVDWTDQAILYLHVGGDAEARKRREARRKTSRKGPAPASVGAGAACPSVMRNLGHLRSFGIRTASDLVQAYDEALRRGRDKAVLLGERCTEQVVAHHQAAEVGLLRAALDLPDAPTGGSVPAIQTIIDTLTDEEWFKQICNWRRSEFGGPDAWYHYLDGHDWTLTHVEPPRRVNEAMSPFVSVPVVVDLTDKSSPPKVTPSAPRGSRRPSARPTGT